LVMSPESAEMTKYVANALLATRISLINEVARICQVLGADINQVRRGIGHDPRIGFAGLSPGVGYGGSSLPQDVSMLCAMAEEHSVESSILQAVDGVNHRQKMTLFEKLRDHFADGFENRTVAIWGLAFKPRTDDVRDAPALVLIDRLLEAGARLCVHDPEAMPKVRRIYGDRLLYGTHAMDVLVGADALAINTQWSEYRHPDFREMHQRMASPVIVDGRNLYHPQQMAAVEFTYHSIGRPSVVAGRQ